MSGRSAAWSSRSTSWATQLAGERSKVGGFDDDAFRGVASCSDVELADRFGVPAAQIALKRRDLAGERAPLSHAREHAG